MKFFPLMSSASALISFVLLFASGCGEKRVLGARPNGTLFHISDLQKADPHSVVILKGLLVEKCPVAGCWFYLRDETGTIKVDTKTAGFVVVGIPLQTELTVEGQCSGSGEFGFDAIGLEY